MPAASVAPCDAPPQRRRGLGIIALAVAAALAPLFLNVSAEARAKTCDRMCLSRTLDAYLAALTSHDRSKVRLASNFRSTENAISVATGEGLWASAQRLGDVQRRYYDPVTNQAAFYGSIDEAAGPALVSLRIKVEDQRIVEAEALVSRAGDRLFNMAGVIANAPAAEPATRSNREAMVAGVDDFFDHLQAHSGEGVRRRPGCVRLENGSGGPTGAGRDCATGFEHLLQIRAVAHRRVTVVDEAAGTVVVTAMFLRPPGATMPDGALWKRNLFTDVFTFDGGLITGVYGVMHGLEAEATETTGWTDPIVHP